METTKNIVWQVWALIGVVFVLGCLTGASVTSLYRSRQGGPMEAGAEGRGGGRRFMLEKLKRELNLNDEQATQVQAIMEDSRKDFRGAFEACPQLKDARDKGTARIRVLLTPEQQQKFDEIRARRDAERKQDDAK